MTTTKYDFYDYPDPDDLVAGDTVTVASQRHGWSVTGVLKAFDGDNVYLWVPVDDLGGEDLQTFSVYSHEVVTAKRVRA